MDDNFLFWAPLIYPDPIPVFENKGDLQYLVIVSSGILLKGSKCFQILLLLPTLADFKFSCQDVDNVWKEFFER